MNREIIGRFTRTHLLNRFWNRKDMTLARKNVEYSLWVTVFSSLEDHLEKGFRSLEGQVYTRAATFMTRH